MHISEGVLSGPVLAVGAAAAAAGVAWGIRKLDGEDLVRTGVLSAAFFAASLVSRAIGFMIVGVLFRVFGAPIKAGDKIGMWYISANRDESVFDNPDKLIVDRENARRHLSFGYGIHRCVGARLAELQIRVLLEEMAKRRLRPNVVAEPVRVAGCFVHGYRSMDDELSRY